MVSAEKGIFHCFGCHEGGDAFKFVMLMDSSAWPEAVRKLAARAGIEIKEGNVDIAKRSERQVLYDILEQAADFYHRVFKDSPAAGAARKYIAKRGVSADSIEKFKIGYAPRGQLLEKALKKGISAEQLAAAGLITKTERGRNFEYMSERLVFPIFDTQGRVVAFGGRTLKDDQPKYLNSPDSAVYSKSAQLYGLFQAMPTLRKKAEVIVLEGYMDVVVTHQYGATNTVATSGTALTQQQSQLLKRYSDKITLLFDSDSAGENAAKRAIDTLLETELAISVAAMPEGVDPDEYLLEHGADKFYDLLKSSNMSAEEFLVSQAEKVFGFKSPEAKTKAAAAIIPYLEKIKNAVLRSEWIKYVSERIGVTEEAFLDEWNRRKRPQAGKLPGEAKARALTGNSRSAEEQLVQLLASHTELAAGVKPDIFNDERCRKVFDAIAGGTAPAKLVESFAGADASWLTELMLEDKVYSNPGHMLTIMLNDIRKAELEIQRRKLESEVNKMLSGEIQRDEQKIQKWNDLNIKLKGSVK
jgi:DNA primase